METHFRVTKDLEVDNRIEHAIWFNQTIWHDIDGILNLLILMRKHALDMIHKQGILPEYDPLIWMAEANPVAKHGSPRDKKFLVWVCHNTTPHGNFITPNYMWWEEGDEEDGSQRPPIAH